MLRDNLRVIKNKILNSKTAKRTISIAIFFAVLFFGVKGFASPDYQLPEYIRVGLVNNFKQKTQISTSTKSLTVGYESDDYKETGDEYFKEIGTFDCAKGFYFVINDSNRFTSKLYDDYDELLDDIGDSTDYIPLLLGENKYKIVTKAGRSSSDLCPDSYSNLNSIVMVSGDNKETLVFEGNDYPIFGSNEDTDPKIMKISTTTANKSYRGWIKFINEAGRVSAVSHVNFDEYLYGVITSEMPKEWHPEALKAQALCARNYSFLRILYNEGTYLFYDLVDSTLDQVYGGYSNESAAGKKAADATSGEVIIYTGSNSRYKDKLIDAYFSSCNGGAIEASENVWSSELPYCVAKVDPYEKPNKYYGWTSKFTLSDITNAMNKRGTSVGNVTSVTIEETSVGRAKTLIITGSKGTQKIFGDKIRTFFNTYMPEGIKSCNFELYTGNNVKTVNETKSNMVYVYGNKSVSKSFADLSILNGKDGVEGEVYAINSSKNITKLEASTTTAVEQKNEYNLKKGEYLIVGKGYGHGLGMSQYGANDMAEAGYSYKDIIKFYYTDVDIIHIN